jgi:glycosyltransferase involved in cell wall biosynthesis
MFCIEQPHELTEPSGAPVSVTSTIAIVNNHAETFGVAGSGAIATHVWECWRASPADARPHVYTRLGTGEPYGAKPLSVLPAHRGDHYELAMRARRRLAKSMGWSAWSQRAYASELQAPLDADIDSCPAMIIFHNDPEIALRVALRYPRADVRHLFHNLLDVSPKTLEALRRGRVRLFAVSDYVARWVEAAAGLREGTVETVYNGVDSTAFSPRASRTTAQMFTIGFLGRPGIEKAPDVLLEAVAHMRSVESVQVLLAGANYLTHHVMDDYQRQLDDIGKQIEAGGGRFTRIGQLARAEVPDFLRRLDTLVVPSRWEEPCALVLFEAMATGLPVVATRTGGTPEVVGDVAVLFEQDDVHGLSQTLEDLLNDAPRREQLSSAARARAEGFTWAATWAGLTGEPGTG